MAQLILVGILTVVFVIMGIHKQISFCDEMFTYDSANSDLPVGRSILNTEEWVTGNEIQNFLSASEISLDAYKMISYHLYKDHVPLYFWMFRTVSALLFSDSYTKWIGLVCNYPFYIGMGLLLYRFFSKRFGGVFSFLCVLPVMLHPCMIAQATMIRMYQMFSFILLFFMLQIKTNYLKKAGYRIMMGILLAAGLLTHYHFWIYAIAFSGFYCIGLVIKRKYMEIFYYVQICIVGLLLTTVFYSSWRIFLFAGKGETSIHNLLRFEGLLKHMGAGLRSLTTFVFDGKVILGCVILGLLVTVFLCFDRLNSGLFYVIAGATILYIFVIEHSTGRAAERYYWPAINVVLIGISYCVCSICQHLQGYFNCQKRKQICMCCGGMLLAGFLFYGICMARDPMRISYLKSRTEEETKEIMALTHIPWLVFSDDIGSLYHGLYDLAFVDELRRVPMDGTPYYDEKIADSKKAVILTIESNRDIESCLRYLEDSSNHIYTNVSRIGTSGVYSVYVAE